MITYILTGCESRLLRLNFPSPRHINPSFHKCIRSKIPQCEGLFVRRIQVVQSVLFAQTFNTYEYKSYRSPLMRSTCTNHLKIFRSTLSLIFPLTPTLRLTPSFPLHLSILVTRRIHRKYLTTITYSSSLVHPHTPCSIYLSDVL